MNVFVNLLYLIRCVVEFLLFIWIDEVNECVFLLICFGWFVALVEFWVILELYINVCVVITEFDEADLHRSWIVSWILLF